MQLKVLSHFEMFELSLSLLLFGIISIPAIGKKGSNQCICGQVHRDHLTVF